MLKDNSNAVKIAQVFVDYCKKRSYQLKVTKTPDNDLRLEVSNFRDRTIVVIYHTSKVVNQGPQNALRAEMEGLKNEFEEDPSSFISVKVSDSKACATRYDIMLPSLRNLVKDSLAGIHGANVNISDNPSKNIEYSAKVQRGHFSVTLTQYSNGTLLLQGKDDAIFDEACDLIDTLCNPSEKEVVSRFISSDEESLRIFAAKYTPELVSLAEKKTKELLGDVYGFLEPHDQKWFVASECISMTGIPLPEYSPVVMPASKAFEGFSKKLLLSIGLFPADHFKNKAANFSNLHDVNNPLRKAICAKDKYADTMLKKLASCIDTNRNFMLHSDDAKVTKIESPKEAREKLGVIIGETREIFKYFNNLYRLL